MQVHVFSGILIDVMSSLCASVWFAGDDTLKLWDIRKFKSPLCVADDLYNLYPV